MIVLCYYLKTFTALLLKIKIVPQASGHVTRLQANFFGEPTQEEDFFFHISFRNDENKTFGPKFKAFCVWKPDRDIAIDEACAIPVFSSVLKRYCVKKDLLMDIDIVKNC